MRDLISKAAALARRYRRWLLGAAIVLVLYALAGFVLAPWLARNAAIDGVREIYDAELKIARVAINPFVLSFGVEGLEMDDPDGKPFARVARIFVNFQLSSMFRRAWTFREVRVDSPEIFLARHRDGGLNLAFLLGPGDKPAEAPDDSGNSGPVRLLIHDFRVSEAVAHWDDAVPVDPVDTTFGPVNVAVAELNTLPQREGRQDVVITTESEGTLAWSGSLQLNPLRSSGHASVKGSHFPLLSAYIRHQAGFEVFRGDADIELDYAVDTLEGGAFAASVDNFELGLSDVAVRTFSGANPTAAEREVLELPSLTLAGGALRWPERRLSLARITIDDAAVSAYRNGDGELNLVPIADEAAADDTAAPRATTGEPWVAGLDRLEVNRMLIGLIDDSVVPQADIGVEDLELVVTGVSNAPGTRFPTMFSARTRSGGSVGAVGGLTVLPGVIADFELEIDGVSLAVLHPYLKALADVHLESGDLELSGRLSSSPDNPLEVTGDLAVVNFLLTETDEGSRLGSWDRFEANGVSLDLGGRNLGVSEVRLDQAYADVFIADDGSVNLGRIGKGRADDADEGTDNGSSGPEDNAPPFDVTVGRVVIDGAAADFADYSLPLPFEAKISALNGGLSTIATTSAEPSEVSLEGKVDEFGLVRVSGTVTPMEPARDTDLDVTFQNVEIPKFSAYSIPFAGREIASGKLDLDLGYAVAGGDLVGENRIVLREFELGEKVDHPGAMSLPLGLAVALLKDPSGKIDIDLPVRGNVNDPEFSYGGVVLKALANLIVKIVASPFALLGNLVGVEASELEQINFVIGRADLTPPERERAAKLAEALALRPELVLEIAGVFDRDADALALRKAQLDTLVEERIEVGGAEDKPYTERRRGALEALFRELGGAEEPGADLSAMRAENTSSATDEDSGRTTEQFDELAYVADIERRLVSALPVSEQALSALAGSRAANVRAAIIGIDPALEGRISVIDEHAAARAQEDTVAMKVRLTVAGDTEA